MRTIALRSVAVTEKILTRLEKKGLIRTLRPTSKILKLGARKKGGVDAIYSSAPRSGSHKLICVTKEDSCEIALNFHPDNEEFIILNNTSLKYKPLYIVIGLRKYKEFKARAENKRLSKNDFIVLRMKYNDHKTCIFTMLKGTPHCEAVLPGKGRPPVFFVTEPANLGMTGIDLPGYDLKLR
jgi:hypothetical protein